MDTQITCWTLRTLVRLGARCAEPNRAPYNFDVLRTLGVQLPPSADADEPPEGGTVHSAIVARLEALEAAGVEAGSACENARLLGKLLGLSDVEVAVLALTIAFDSESRLSSSFSLLRAQSLAHIAQHVAAVLQLAERDVEDALRRDARLRDLGLIELARSDDAYEGAPVTLGAVISSVLLRPLQNQDELLGHFLDRMAPSTLALSDYPHLAADIELLQSLLRAALAHGETGVNVLLHGPPGTGKTELARALAAAVGARLHSVKLVDRDEDVRNGDARLESYAVCSRILTGCTNTLLLFDEVEDAFPVGSWLTRFASTRNKAWTTRLLETNPVPTLWVGNAIDQIDRAIVRRFDFVLELAEPPRSVRRRVLEKHLADFALSSSALDRLAEREHLSPGHVQRASRALRLLHSLPSRDAQADLDRVVTANMRAYARYDRPRRAGPDLRYDLSLLRTDIHPVQLVQALARERSGTLCFYGPPGTGKTALAHHLARELDMPLLEYRASDLISKWVGDTERAIARMFERAAGESAVLLLDEADSFLGERRLAHQHWEVTQVNEMLAQMEHYAGIFICSTNLVEHLDAAALRRFAIKVRFDYLESPQIERLFLELLSTVGERGELGSALEEAKRLRKLTPGDFAAVARKLRILGSPPTAAGLQRALRDELALKRGAARPIGFA